MGESSHELGRDYVIELQEFLEKTYNFNSLFTVYGPYDSTLMEKLNGDSKKFDLAGSFEENSDLIPVFIEAKNDSNSARLIREYKNFLKDCFSVWVKKRKLSRRWNARFLFISSYPFLCNDFSKHKKADFLAEVFEDIDDDLKNYFNLHQAEVISSFLEFVDILILTPSCELISANIPKIAKKYLI